MHMTTTDKPLRPRQGFTLLETLLILMLLISSLLLTAQYAEQIVDENSVTTAARQLNTVSRQARQCVNAKWPLILKALEERRVKGEGAIAYEVPEDLLDAIKPTVNPYQQKYQFRVFSEKPTRWQLWVTTQGGRPIPQRAWSRISTPLAPSLGYTKSDEKGGLVIVGQQSLWSQAWPTKLGGNPGNGHLVTRYDLNLPEVTSADCLLYRKAIVGTPRLNHMQSSLQLQKNKIMFSQGSLLDPQQWQLKNGENCLEAAASLPSILLKDTTNKKANLTHQVMSIDHASPFKSTLQVVADKEYIPIEKVQDWRAWFRGRKRNTCENANEQSGPQLHYLWHQLPYHIQTEKNSNPKIFANDLCQESSVYLSGLGRMFIVKDITNNTASLFICGKGKSKEKPEAYEWEKFKDRYVENLYFDHPPFIIHLPKTINKQQAQKIYEFTKDVIERKLYIYFSIVCYSKNLAENYPRDILQKKLIMNLKIF